MARTPKRVPTAVTALKREMRAYVKQDQVEHERLYGAVDGINDRLDDITRTVGDMGRALGKTCGQLEVLTKVIEEDRKARHEADNIELEAQAQIEVVEKTTEAQVGAAEETAKIEDATDKKKFKRKMIAMAVGALYSGITTLVLILEHC